MKRNWREISPPLSLHAKRVVEVPPYAKLANFYDRLMWHVNYVNWSNYIYQVLTLSNVPNGVWCDGACGSGSIVLLIHQKGIPIVGFDQSEEMIQLARKKASSVAAEIQFEVESFHNFNFQNLAALFTVYDSINYLLTHSDVLTFLKRVYHSLITNGLILFDLSTQQNCLRNLNNWIDQQTLGDWTYRRHSWYSEATRLHHNDFEILHCDDPSTVYLEKHIQRIYPIDEVLKLVKEAGFQIISVFANTTLLNGTEKHDRVHILARKLT